MNETDAFFRLDSFEVFDSTKKITKKTINKLNK